MCVCVCDCEFVCNWVLVLVRMSHPSAAARQDVASFIRWPIVCVIVCLVCNWVLVLVRMSHLSLGGPLCGCVIVRLACDWVLGLVRMSHPLAVACQDVPSFIRWPIVCDCVIASLC